MARITSGDSYTISIQGDDGIELYLTATQDGGLVTLTEYEAGNNQQFWSLNIDNELYSSDPNSSAGLCLVGDTTPCTNTNSEPSTRNYYIIEGDDTSDYTIQWWSIDPLPDGSSKGYLVPDGSSNVKISPNPQKWKFGNKIKGSGGWVIPEKSK